MPAVTLTPGDLTSFAEIPEAKAQAMIDDALALATVIAPCIMTDDFAHAAAARAVLRGAILRWNDVPSGVASRTVGGVSETYADQQRRTLFWPSEIEQLQSLCSTGASSPAFTIDTTPAATRDGENGYWATPSDWVTLP